MLKMFTKAQWNKFEKSKLFLKEKNGAIFNEEYGIATFSWDSYKEISKVKKELKERGIRFNEVAGGIKLDISLL